MTYWHKALRGGFAAIGLLSFLASASAGNIDGDYAAQGRALDGKAYSGDVKMKSFGPTEAIVWRVQENQGYKGLGIVSGGILGAAYAIDKSYFGVAVYDVRSGFLEGVWTDASNPKATGREVLEGPANLNGTYKITTGEQLDGLTNYTGRVVIKPNGKTYLVLWFGEAQMSTPISAGIGVLVDNKLVVAFGKDRIPGVVAYKIDGETLDGVWSFGGSKELGTETLTRKP